MSNKTKFGKTLSELSDSISAEFFLPRLLYKGTIEEKVIFLARCSTMVKEGHHQTRHFGLLMEKVTNDILNKLPKEKNTKNEDGEE